MNRDVNTMKHAAEPVPHNPRPRHPIDIQNAGLPPELAKSRYGKWRALALILVYVLMIIHITHWKVKGETMAPLELSEIMKALEQGVISPGVIFIGVMLIGSALFGRFFCSWACHMLALQDLFHWILKKLRIRPLAVRSRVLLLVPFLTAGYMFFWPQVQRLWEGRELPEASARLVTTDFWRDLPGPLVITLTVLTCGLLIVYLFGGRGFCTYACPYGVLFGIMDRFAPGKIRARDGCVQCAKCTAICTSNIIVHQETKAYGMVVDPRCMKDLDCVSVCPQNVLHFGFGRPTVSKPKAVAGFGFSILEEFGLVALFIIALFAWRSLAGGLPILVVLAMSALTAYLAVAAMRLLLRSKRDAASTVRPPAVDYDFSIPEEIAMVAIFLLGWFTWRTLYDRLPYLMSIALSVATAYIAVTFFRLFRRRELNLNRYLLKTGGRLTRPGRIFLAAASLFLLFFLHSAFIQYDRHRGGVYLAAAESVQGSDAEAVATRRAAWQHSVFHLQRCDRWGLASTTNLEFKLGVLMLELDRIEEAEAYLTRAVERSPNFPEARINLAKALEKRGQTRQAAGHLTYALEIYSPHEEYQPRYRHLYAKAHVSLGRLLVGLAERQPDAKQRQEQIARAEQHYRQALEFEEHNLGAHLGLGFLVSQQGGDGLHRAVEHYRTAIRLDPQSAWAHANLGDVLVALNQPEQAIAEYQQALAGDAQIEKVHYKIGFLHLHLANLPKALEHLAAAVEQNPADAEAHLAYAQALARAGRPADASEHYQRAQSLTGSG